MAPVARRRQQASNAAEGKSRRELREMMQMKDEGSFVYDMSILRSLRRFDNWVDDTVDALYEHIPGVVSPEIDADDIDGGEGEEDERESKLRAVLKGLPASEKLENFIRDFVMGLNGKFVPPEHVVPKVSIAAVPVARRVTRRLTEIVLKVRFADVNIREFKNAIGDSVPSDRGPSMGLSWTILSESAFTLDDYEEKRKDLRMGRQTYAKKGTIPLLERHWMLKKCGHRKMSIDQNMLDLKEIRKSRQETRHAVRMERLAERSDTESSPDSSPVQRSPRTLQRSASGPSPRSPGKSPRDRSRTGSGRIRALERPTEPPSPRSVGKSPRDRSRPGQSKSPRTDSARGRHSEHSPSSKSSSAAGKSPSSSRRGLGNARERDAHNSRSAVRGGKGGSFKVRKSKDVKTKPRHRGSAPSQLLNEVRTLSEGGSVASDSEARSRRIVATEVALAPLEGAPSLPNHDPLEESYSSIISDSTPETSGASWLDPMAIGDAKARAAAGAASATVAQPSLPRTDSGSNNSPVQKLDPLDATPAVREVVVSSVKASPTLAPMTRNFGSVGASPLDFDFPDDEDDEE